MSIAPRDTFGCVPPRASRSVSFTWANSYSHRRSEPNWLQAIAWLELAEGHGFTAAQSVLEPERTKLTPEQRTLITRLKNQLERKP